MYVMHRLYDAWLVIGVKVYSIAIVSDCKCHQIEIQ